MDSGIVTVIINVNGTCMIPVWNKWWILLGNDSIMPPSSHLVLSWMNKLKCIMCPNQSLMYVQLSEFIVAQQIWHISLESRSTVWTFTQNWHLSLIWIEMECFYKSGWDKPQQLIMDYTHTYFTQMPFSGWDKPGIEMSWDPGEINPLYKYNSI